MTVLLANVHSDNFGDHLNARAAVLLCEQLGVGITGLSYARHPWVNQVETTSLLPHDMSMLGFRWGRLDSCLHSLRLPHLCVNSSQWRNMDEMVERSSLVISVPAGAGIGPYQDGSLLTPLISAHRKNVPACLAFGTVLPSGSRTFDRCALKALDKVLLSVRDRGSQAYLERYGRPVISGFDLSGTAISDISGVEPKASRRDVATIVAGPQLSWHPNERSAKGGRRSKDHLTLLLRCAIAANCRNVELLPHSGLDEEIDQLKKAASLFDGAVDVCVRDDVRSAVDYVEVISSSSLLIGLRYHSILTAIMTGTSVVALSYEEKTVDLVSRFPEMMLPFDIDAVSEADLVDAIRVALRNSTSEKSAAAERSSAAILAARDSQKVLADAIRDRWPDLRS